MIDLSAFNQKHGESWADIMDEEEEENDRNRHPHTDEKKVQQPPPEEPKTSGIVWNIPSKERKQEQRQVMELLIERRQNIDSLDNWRRKDDDVRKGDDVNSWRSGKRYREPEKNNASGWAAYSQVLQEEYEQEREDARQEFIRRFGSAPGEDDEPPRQPPPQPVVISVSADGPSDWADDLPSDEEQHADYLSDDLPEEVEITVCPDNNPVEVERAPEEDKGVLPEEPKEEAQQEVAPPEEPKQSADPAPPQPVASTVSSSDGWRTGGSTDAAPVTPLSDSQDDTTVKVEAWRTQVATTSPQQSTAWADFAAQHSQPTKPAIVVEDQSCSLPEPTSDAGSEHSWHAAPQKQSSSPPEQCQSQSERTAWPTARSPRMQILNHLFKNKATRSTETTDGVQRWNAFAGQQTKRDDVSDDTQSHTSKTSHLENSTPVSKEEDDSWRAAAAWTTNNDDSHSHTSKTSHRESSSPGANTKEGDGNWRAGVSWTNDNAPTSRNEKAASVWNAKEDDGSRRATTAWNTNNDDAHSHGSYGKTRIDDDARSYTSRTSETRSEGKRSPARVGNNDNVRANKDGLASPAWNAFSDSNSRNHGNRRVERPSNVERPSKDEQLYTVEQRLKGEPTSKDERASPAWNSFSSDSTIRNHGNWKGGPTSKIEQVSKVEQAPEDEQASKNELAPPDWNTFDNNYKSHNTSNGHVSPFSNDDNNRGRKIKGSSENVDDSWRAAATWTTSWSSPSCLETNQSARVDQVASVNVAAIRDQPVDANQSVNTTESLGAKQTGNRVSGESRWQAYAKEHSERISRSTTPINKPWS